MIRWGHGGPKTGFSPSLTDIFHATCVPPLPIPSPPLQTTILPLLKGGDFKFELWPLHSPLLRPSSLVSSPPRNDMLKFRGSSCLSTLFYRPEATHLGDLMRL